MASTDVLVVNDTSQDALLRYITAAGNINDEGWDLRHRLESVDRAYMREMDRSKESQAAKGAVKSGNITKLQNLEVPMVMESVENSVAFLTNVYLLDYPIFKFGAGPDKQNIALQWNTLVGEDQIHYGWAGNFNIAFRSGAKYNFSPLEIEWKTKRIWKVLNGTGVGGTKLQEVLWEGNCISAKDPYNLIYDQRVPIHKVHTDGEFIGYRERITRIQLKMFFAELGDDRLKNDKKAFESNEASAEIYTPVINWNSMRHGNMDAGGFNWVTWVTGQAQNHIKYQNAYTKTVLYARLMPFEFGIRAPKDQTPDIWKLVAINNVLVYARPLPNAHEYLPMVIVQPLADIDSLSYQTKSQAENQQPFQEMVSALWNAKLASARRRVTDRMLYNPLLVDPDHINSPNPSAKIPVRNSAYGRKLEEAVYPFPFHDENSQFFIQEANGIAEWGMRANGQNRVSLGQFQKGNKLQDEFNTVMNNAGARERTQAIMWHGFGMQPIKEMMKSNYLQFAPGGKLYNRKENVEVEINPVELREAAAEFEIGDGLLPIEKIVHVDVMAPALQVIATAPDIGKDYNVGDMFAYMMKAQGVDKLDQFKKPPEQVQYEQALAAWQNAALALADKKDMTPEQIQQALGPMPQPPQPVNPQQVPQRGNPNAGA